MSHFSLFRSLVPVFAPAGYLVLCAMVGAVLGYPLVLALQGSMPLHVLIGRLSQACLFLGMWPIARYLQIRKTDFGFPTGWGRLLKHMALGWGLGVALLGTHALVLLLLDIRVGNPEKLASWDGIYQSGLKALWTGLAVAFLEEPLFRGFLLGSLAKATPRLAAMVICSLYFALLHFLKTDIRPEFAEVRWYTGFPVAFDAFIHLFDKIQLDTFLALFSAGMLLAVVRLWRPGYLGYCIGIHAGWVFVIKFTRSLTKANPSEPWLFLVGQYDGVIGYLATAWMTVLVVILMLSQHYFQARKPV